MSSRLAAAVHKMSKTDDAVSSCSSCITPPDRIEIVSWHYQRAHACITRALASICLQLARVCRGLRRAISPSLTGFVDRMLVGGRGGEQRYRIKMGGRVHGDPASARARCQHRATRTCTPCRRASTNSRQAAADCSRPAYIPAMTFSQLGQSASRRRYSTLMPAARHESSH